MQDFTLAEKFGWTPGQIKNIDEEEKLKFLSILKGINMAKPKDK